MTVKSQVTKVVGPGNGLATTFSFSPMVIYNSSDLSVVHVSATGIETPLAEGESSVNYKVQVGRYPGTGNVIYPADEIIPMPVGESIIIKRIMPLEQGTDLNTQGGYDPEVQEDMHDRGIMIDLQQQEELDRTIRYPITEFSTIDQRTLPTVEERRNQFFAWNEDGDIIPALPDSGGIPHTPWGAAWVAQTESVQGRNTLQTRIFDYFDGVPGSGEDSTQGFARLDMLVDQNTNELYLCQDASVGSAIWVVWPWGGSGGGGGGGGHYVGQMAIFFGSIPSGFLPLDGRLLDSVTNPEYAALFAEIGTTWGGTGPNAFNIPEARGRTIIGEGTGPGLTPRFLGGTGGAEAVQLTSDESGLPSHTHPDGPSNTDGDGSGTGIFWRGTGGTISASAPQDAAQAHENMPPWAVGQMAICYDPDLAPSTSSFLELTDTPSSYVGQGGKWVTVGLGETGLTFTDRVFLALQDTDNSYAGRGDLVVRVKGSEDGLDFRVVNFLELGDTDNDYTGRGDLFVRVKTAEDGLDFRGAEFTELSDTPPLYAGAALQAVRVNAAEDALEFVNFPSGGVATFLELTDTPGTYVGSENLAVAVNGAGTALEFIPFPTGGGGEANDGANVGGGVGAVFRDKTGVVLNFKTLDPTAASSIQIINLADTVDLQLEGDEAAPGIYEFYSTDLLGIKGWYQFPIPITNIARNDADNAFSASQTIDVTAAVAALDLHSGNNAAQVYFRPGIGTPGARSFAEQAVNGFWELLRTDDGGVTGVNPEVLRVSWADQSLDTPNGNLLEQGSRVLTTLSNIGGGVAIFDNKTGGNAALRSLAASGLYTDVSSAAGLITIDLKDQVLATDKSSTYDADKGVAGTVRNVASGGTYTPDPLQGQHIALTGTAATTIGLMTEQSDVRIEVPEAVAITLNAAYAENGTPATGRASLLQISRTGATAVASWM